MKKLFYILIIAQCTLNIDNCYSQWVTQNSGTTQHLYDVFFIDTSIGWACGNNGTIIKTTNGGNNWFGLNSGVSQAINTIHFVDNIKGWFGTRVIGQVFKTTDGGNIWSMLLQTYTFSIQSIYFLDSLYGWATGDGLPYKVFRTTNGGNNWDSTLATPGRGNHIYFINSNTGWVSVGGGIHKSTDGGQNWAFQYSTIGYGDIADFYFINLNTGWLFTDGYTVFKTTNSGNNWFLQIQLTGQANGHSIFFSSMNTGWVSGDYGFVSKTSDGGQSWFIQNTGTTNFLNSVFFLTDSIGYAVGGAGKIIYTRTSGEILSVNKINSEIPCKFKLYQNYPNPFNNNTSILFDIVKNDNYCLEIIDLLGRTIQILFSRKLNGGTYKVMFEALNISSGIYFLKLSSRELMQVKKIILIR